MDISIYISYDSKLAKECFISTCVIFFTGPQCLSTSHYSSCQLCSRDNIRFCLRIISGYIYIFRRYINYYIMIYIWRYIYIWNEWNSWNINHTVVNVFLVSNPFTVVITSSSRSRFFIGCMKFLPHVLTCTTRWLMGC